MFDLSGSITKAAKRRVDVKHYFAKPVSTHHRLCLRHTLLTQLQTFRKSGQMHEIAEFVAIGFFSRLSSDVRLVTKRVGHCPTFMMKKTVLVSRAHGDGSGTDVTYVVGAVICGTDHRKLHGSGRVIVQTQSIAVGLFKTPEGQYGMLLGESLIATWRLKTHKTGDPGFELENKKKTIIDRSLRYNGRCAKVVVDRNGVTFSTSRNALGEKAETEMRTEVRDWEDLVVLAATWIAYEEGWLSW